MEVFVIENSSLIFRSRWMAVMVDRIVEGMLSIERGEQRIYVVLARVHDRAASIRKLVNYS